MCEACKIRVVQARSEVSTLYLDFTERTGSAADGDGNAVSVAGKSNGDDGSGVREEVSD